MIGFIIGFIIGSWFGLVIVAILAMAREGNKDDRR